MSNPGRTTPHPDEAWAIAKALFLCGLPTLECATRSGIPADTVSQRISRENWVSLRMHWQELKPVDVRGLEGDSAVAKLGSQLKLIIANDLHRSVTTLARCRHAANVAR